MKIMAELNVVYPLTQILVCVTLIINDPYMYASGILTLTLVMSGFCASSNLKIGHSNSIFRESECGCG